MKSGVIKSQCDWKKTKHQSRWYSKDKLGVVLNERKNKITTSNRAVVCLSPSILSNHLYVSGYDEWMPTWMRSRCKSCFVDLSLSEWHGQCIVHLSRGRYADLVYRLSERHFSTPFLSLFLRTNERYVTPWRFWLVNMFHKTDESDQWTKGQTPK